MPSLAELGLDLNPSTEPAGYPGRSVAGSSLLVGSWLYELQPSARQPLDRWAVAGDGGPLKGDRVARLGNALNVLGVAPLTERFPVLAVGSNASPGQLTHKYADSGAQNVVPLTAVTVSGVGVAFSAHISRPGYMPFAPVADSRSTRRLFLLWLDPEQMTLMDATEPNYRPATRPAALSTAVLESGDSMSEYSLYRSRWGVYQHSGQVAGADSQDVAFSMLGQHTWFSGLVPEVRRGPTSALTALGADPDRRTRVREGLAAGGHAAPDGFPPVTFAPIPYGGRAPAAPPV